MEEGFRDILSCYSFVMSSDLSHISDKSKRMKLPIVPKQLLQSLLSEAKSVFSEEPVILSIPVPTVVIGDIHGHILDLLRILKEHQLPPTTRYLFLGDFIDRGEFSTEVMILVLTLKVLFPDDVFVVRGNHEFAPILDHTGFFRELYNLYNDDTLKDEFMDVFSYMPLAANAQGFALCVHGGIGPSWYFLEQLKDLKRPIVDFENQLVTEILWSDPTDNTDTYEDSHRGMGVHFGKTPLMNFLQRTGFTYIVRGHQCVKQGCETSLNSRVITVFSASNYCGCDDNKCGVLILQREETYDTACYDKFNWIKRDEASFQPLDVMKDEIRPKKKPQTPSPSKKLGSYDGRNQTAVQSALVLPKIPISPPKPLWRKDRRLAEGRGSDALATQRALPRVTKPTQLPKKPRRYTSGG